MANNSPMKFNIVVCGGTFDHFHKGHASFLRFILSLTQKVVLGLTSDKYTQTEKNGHIESYLDRKNSIEKYNYKHYSTNIWNSHQ